MELLDNPAWHSMDLQGDFVEGAGHARRYRPDVDPLASLVDGASPEAWAALRPLISDGEAVHLLHPSFEVPTDWGIHHRGTVMQMVGVEAPPARDGIDFVELGDEDAPEMLALALRTQPGPFAKRTHELGEFIGVRSAGRLVAMAGERFVLPGMTEVSAVCTDPEFRGRGWAAALTGEIAARIFERDEQPFLHVVESNTTARRVYERIGFEDRRVLEHVYVSPVAE
jgi:ribosomal protein S18 acetylase RimI-like enzyme